MPKVKIGIDRAFMDDLEKESGSVNSLQLTNEAFSLLMWAIKQAKQGRVLLTLDQYGENPLKVDLPSINANLKRIDIDSVEAPIS
jgi:hypothetical protein